MIITKTVHNAEEFLKQQRFIEHSGFRHIGNGEYWNEKRNITIRLIWK